MKKGWIILGVAVLFLVIIAGSVVKRYNTLVMLNEAIPGAWAQVENVLQRRYDLIPNLVNTVKGYAKHEGELFEQFAIARQMQAGAKSVKQKVRASNAMESFLGRLMVVVERYPDLKANQNFLKLQDELAGTENRIAVERRRYNDIVRRYNTAVKMFPSNIIAGMFGFESKEDSYFEMAEGAETAPVVDFGK